MYINKLAAHLGVIAFLQLSGKLPHAENCIEQTLVFPYRVRTEMRIRTTLDFEIQCLLYNKSQNPDCAVRIAVKGA